MPVVDNGSTGQSPAATSSSSSKKEKKKQAKEERDRQKQAEKKKRRLEKALATATAIRIELEQKKQKRKEEEQRLDEEGAALAEAVALQVLVDEDRGIQTMNVNFMDKTACGLKPLVSVRRKEIGQQIGIKQRGNYVRHSRVTEIRENCEYSSNDAGIVEGTSDMRDGDFFSVDNCLSCEAHSSIEEESRITSERARDAEIAAGLAAARAVAALRIAEEARAEAEAARMAAELCMFKNLEKKDSSYLDLFLHECTLPPKSAEEERDELKVQLLQMEHTLQEKTRKVFQLEQDLEHVKHYLLEFKAMTTNSTDNDGFEVNMKREPEISSNVTVTKSSSDSIDLKSY